MSTPSTDGAAPYTLILLRHGESEWNAKNLFTGWVDVPLSEKGEAEAGTGRAARVVRAPAGRRPHLAAAPGHHDGQHRARRRRPALDPRAAQLAAQRAPLRRAAGQGQEADPRGVRRGAVHALAPLVRRPAAADRGRLGVLAGRRPPLRRPRCRSRARSASADVLERFLPYWENAIVPDLRDGKVVLVAAHGNSLRALVKHLDGIDDETIAGAQHPHRHAAGLPARRGLTPVVAGGSTSTPTPPRGRRGRGQPGPLTRRLTRFRRLRPRLSRANHGGGGAAPPVRPRLAAQAG